MLFGTTTGYNVCHRIESVMSKSHRVHYCSQSKTSVGCRNDHGILLGFRAGAILLTISELRIRGNSSFMHNTAYDGGETWLILATLP